MDGTLVWSSLRFTRQISRFDTLSVLFSSSAPTTQTSPGCGPKVDQPRQTTAALATRSWLSFAKEETSTLVPEKHFLPAYSSAPGEFDRFFLCLKHFELADWSSWLPGLRFQIDPERNFPSAKTAI